MEKKNVTAAALAALTAGLNQRKKVVKYLQPYYFQGGRWFKLKVKK